MPLKILKNILLLIIYFKKSIQTRLFNEKVGYEKKKEETSGYEKEKNENIQFSSNGLGKFNSIVDYNSMKDL